MRMRARIATLLVVLGLALPALAMNLNEAMGALSGAKARGQLGEMPNGYIGVVSAGDQAEEIARLINQARRAEYQRLARENGIKLGDVEAIAGQKALEKTPRGQYIQLNGKWIRK
ncbi:YdbL family protein [Azotobacter salinestris]|uniref:YdbL family protein n=1 Tax=Azotobacter salinestris TaxID=69964 RepID=UPI0032DE9ABD